nr:MULTISPECIES: hypothetical protein [unclassified Bradyrhizobium]
MTYVEAMPRAATMTDKDRRVIVAASLGTIFEFYDFFLIGLLATEIAKAFFSGVNPTAGFIFTLLVSPRASCCGPSAPKRLANSVFADCRRPLKRGCATSRSLA